MSKYAELLLTEAGIIFICIFVLCFFVFGSSKEEGLVKKRTGIYKSFSFKTTIYIFLAAFGITYFVSGIAHSGLTSAIVFVFVLALAPLILNNEKKRVEQEELFAEVILYCQNMGMLLKQTHNVFSSLKKAAEDLNTSLGDDLKGLLKSLEEGKEETYGAMAALEQNYPYSCIRNLDVIILHMFYETANVDDSLLATYQDDVTTLEQDVRRNKAKRKSLRMSYIIITVGSMAAYWYFVRSLSGTFSESFNNGVYRIFNMAYIFCSMLAFFFVDRYFNLNTTKE